MNENKKNQKHRWIYVLLGIIIMLCLGTVYSWSVFRLPVEELFNIGSTESGFPYMFSLAFYSLFMFLTGKYLDKYSPRLIISTGALLVALGWILSAYATNIYFLTLTYGIVIGAGVGIAYGVPMTVVSKWFPEKKGLVVGFVLIGFGLSPLITAPLARRLLDNYGITHTFLVLGIAFGLIIPLLSLPFKYPSMAKESSKVKASLKTNDLTTSQMLKSKNFIGLYCNFIIGTMIGLMIVGITGTVAVKLIKLTPVTSASLMSIFAIFNGTGRPFFGWLTDKLSSKKTMALSYGLIIMAAILMLWAKEDSLIIYSISFCIFWFNLGGWLAIAPASTMAMYGTKHYSQNYGVVFTAYGLGAIAGVLTSGLLLDAFQSFQPIFYLIIGLCILGVFLSQKLIRNS